MKKILATILTIILCLSLCACSGVKQEDYDAAIVKYDALAEEHEALKEKFEPYVAVIDALEAEDYDGAVEAVEALRPAPEVTEVEITMDNLWDYFEITEDRTEQTDAMDNLTRVYIQYSLQLKEEYLLAEADKYPTDVAIGYEYDYTETQYYGSCTLDFENWSCDGNAQWPPFGGHESKMLHFPKNRNLYAALMEYFSGMEGGAILVNENFEVLNASGTLYLVNK